MRKELILTAALVLAIGCSRHSNPSATSAPHGAGPNEAVATAGNQLPAGVGEASPGPGSSVSRAPAAQVTPPAEPEPASAPPPNPEPEAAPEPAVNTVVAVRRIDNNGSAEENHAIVIAEGTPIRVRLAETVDTKHWRTGERFRADLDVPVVVDGRVIVPRGTLFSGHVVESKPSGRLKGRAYLGLALDSFQVHGRTYLVRTAADVRTSGSHKKRNLAFIGGESGGGAAIGAIAGGGVGALIGAGAGAVAGTTTAFITGRKQVKLPVETPMVFTLRSRVRIAG